MPAAMHAFFLDVPGGGQRFCIHHPAAGPAKHGQVLYLHPFAEEMNKSRRMAALQARELASAGFEVLQIDLLGCGDSSGDFGDATWQTWIDDALLGCEWLRRQAAPAPLWLWGLRAGCLLACDVNARLRAPAHLLFMQAPASGKPLLQQFLRLKLAGEMLDGANKGLMASLKATLGRGDAVELAGYMLSADLAQGLETAQLHPLGNGQGGQQVVWLELESQPVAEWSPVAQQLHQRWQEAGSTVIAERVCGPAFWQTTEIEEAPLLLEAACRLLGQAVAAPAPMAKVMQAVAV